MSDRTPFRRTIMLAVAFMLAALFPSIASNAAPAPTGDSRRALRPVVRKFQADRREVKQYWTQRRMERARPLDVTVDVDDARDWTRVPQDDGEPVSVPAIAPTVDGRSALTLDGVASGKVETLTGSIPFTRTEITNTASFPNITHGKLFFSGPGFDAVCSGTVVQAESNDVVWTAGHCVNEGPGSFYSDFLFVPGYRNGAAPAGEWVADGVVTTTQWASAGNFRFDVAALTMSPNGGQEIEEVVGARGIRFNQSHLQSYRTFGHPQTPPFDGERMFVCASDFGIFAPGQGDLRPMGIGCDMTGGSSGGGWIVQDQFVQSVNSFKIIGDPQFEDIMFGPQLGDVALGVFEDASGGGGGDTTAPRIRGVGDKPDPFTPNGDGRKDKTKIFFSTNEQAVVVFRIKSKSGSTAFKIPGSNLPPNHYFVKWNGRHFTTNKVVKAGTYTYKIKATDASGNSSSKSGRTTVRR
ncbi:MAG: trypsin-like serine peptidase [Actinomycetota bacterium]